jgi:hypothetical protein
MNTSNENFCPKKWLSNLLTANQLLEQKNIDPKLFMSSLKTDISIAIPLPVDSIVEEAHNDLKTCLKTIQGKNALKGDKIYAYYRISNYIRERRSLGTKVHIIRQELRKMAKQTSDRIYTIARRVGQLMDALGPPETRTFGILSPDIIFRMKKTDWDNLCNYAVSISSPLTLLDEEVLLTSQELSIQGGNSLTLPESP